MIRIRKAKLEDDFLLQQVAKQSFMDAFANANTAEDLANYLSESFALPRLRAALNNSKVQYYLVYRATLVVGYLKLNLEEAQTQFQDPAGLEIERIYLLRGYYGQGIGKILLDQAIQVARDLNKTYLWLGVWEENIQAIRFYEKHRFQVFGQHHFQLGNDLQTDLEMKLVLETN